MSGEPKIYICVKCGKPFTKWAGGAIMSPHQMELEVHPVCDKCKLNAAAGLFKRK